MPNIRYINQSAPFWDFVASMEQGEHPFANNAQGQQQSWGPWGRRGPHHHHHGGIPHRGPPPYSGQSDEAGPSNEKAADSPDTAQNEDVNMSSNEKDAVPDPPEDTPQEGCGERSKRRCGGEPGARRCGGRGGVRGFGGPRGFHHGPRHGGPGAWGPGFRMLSSLFQTEGQEGESGDWAPDVDVFDTESSFVVHVSLPGANKDDVGVTWDPERSELQIAGVVHRPGDEAFLKTLALDERKVGAFERKIRLGTRAQPAQIDIDSISAKFENGILVVDVPKMIGEFVEVKKVDIE